jgi:hypothetical protein
MRLLPHLLQTIRGVNEGTAVSAGHADTSSSAPCRHSGFRHEMMSRFTPSCRMLPSVIGAPGACFCFVIAGRGQLRSFFNRNRIAVLAFYANLYVARRFANAFVRIEHTDRNN